MALDAPKPSLYSGRCRSQREKLRVAMSIRNSDGESGLPGVSSMEAEFYTEHFMVRGTLTSPDFRLSDHLNSPTATFELSPSLVHRILSGPQMPITGRRTYITKSHVLFVLPDREIAPTDPLGEPLRSETQTHRCLVGVGRHTITGDLHIDPDKNPRLLLRSLEERRFIPFTKSTVTFPDGTRRDAPTAIVNRAHIELLTVEVDPS